VGNFGEHSGVIFREQSETCGKLRGTFRYNIQGTFRYNIQGTIRNMWETSGNIPVQYSGNNQKHVGNFGEHSGVIFREQSETCGILRGTFRCNIQGTIRNMWETSGNIQ
jgi:hypothetical protein